MTYGTQQEVAAMASMWTKGGVWIDPIPNVERGTNPTLTQVNTWLENITGQMNIALQSRLFITPIDPTNNPNAYKAASQYCVSLVADLCHFKNSSGRFFTERLVERGITPMAAILKDMNNWIESNEAGLLADGLLQREVPIKSKQFVFRVMGNFPDR